MPEICPKLLNFVQLSRHLERDADTFMALGLQTHGQDQACVRGSAGSQSRSHEKGMAQPPGFVTVTDQGGINRHTLKGES